MEQLTFKQHCDLGIQHVFDFVVNHLLTQKEKSMCYHECTSEISCAYRGDNNLTCAIGCLISDLEYKEYIEGNFITGLARNYSNFNFLLSSDYGRTYMLLQCLQDIHDGAEIEDWENKLKYLSIRFNLSFNPPIFDMNPYGLYFLQVTPTITAITDGLINYRKVMFVTGFKTGGCTKHQTLESGAKHQIMGYSYQFFKKAATISGLEEFTFDNLTRIYKQE